MIKCYRSLVVLSLAVRSACFARTHSVVACRVGFDPRAVCSVTNGCGIVVIVVVSGEKFSVFNVDRYVIVMSASRALAICRHNTVVQVSICCYWCRRRCYWSQSAFRASVLCCVLRPWHCCLRSHPTESDNAAELPLRPAAAALTRSTAKSIARRCAAFSEAVVSVGGQHNSSCFCRHWPSFPRCCWYMYSRLWRRRWRLVCLSTISAMPIVLNDVLLHSFSTAKTMVMLQYIPRHWVLLVYI